VNIEKNNKTKATLKATKERRKGQVCKVFELKIDYSHLNNESVEKLKRLFLEAKWLYNFALSTDKCFEFPEKTVDVKVKVKDVFEDRKLTVLGSQIKQSVISDLKQNIVNLSKKKKKGGKVGALKFKTRCESVELKQFGTTYKINKNKIHIQGIKQWMAVRGIDQIADKSYEFANAKLVQKASGYYLQVTCYKEIAVIQKEKKEIAKKIKIKPQIKQQIGLDFGIATQITLSNGIEVKYQIAPPVKKMRRLCKRFSKNKSHSSNWYKERTKLGKAYEKVTNQKEDTKNKLMHILKNDFETVCYQNESIKAWQRLWGKRILNTAIGGITASLKKTPTTSMVDKFFPSTKQCPECPNKQEISLDERMFVCSCCGYTKQRDWKAAEMIRDEGLKNIGAERIKFKPVEIRTNTEYLLGKLNAIHRVKARSIDEAGSPSYL
jgi:putative transposase